MRVAIGQVNTTVGDMEGNVAKMLRFARQASEAEAELILFPEMAIAGYPPRDLVQVNGFAEDNRHWLMHLARNLPKGLTAVAGYVSHSALKAGKPFANSGAVLRDGKVIYDQAKVLLPTYDVFDEQRNFEPGRDLKPFRAGAKQVGLTICEDSWNDKYFWKQRLYERDPVEEVMKSKPAFLVNISASPYAYGKRAFRREMLGAIARRHKVPVLFANLVGGNDSLVFDGSSFVLDASGKVFAQAKSFDEDLLLCDVDAKSKGAAPQVECETEAVFQALVLGTRDYCFKCGFQKAVIGLSGGIDSSLVAVIAAHALGPENVIGVAMPGPFSSEGSLRDARQLAEKLGVRFEVVAINEQFDVFRKALRPVFGNLPEDVTEENLQARIRGTTLMALSNKYRAIVLTTGNKSELATGYCTLYGDMVGGLAVIADIYKGMVYEISRWINRDGEVIPQSSIDKAPSAELRPNQTDQDTLPPYDVLDCILRDYIEDNAGAEQIAKKRKLPMALVEDVILRVHRNEYKRQQAAPSLKVSPKAFGAGRVFPIAHKYWS
jgi:NAD+ synthase/NAD+ synthase (glutamine-hydrolysing)